MFISYESKHCFLYRNYSKMFNNFNVLFCRRQQDNFRDSSKHYETGLVKKIEFSKRFRLSEAVHRATTYCLTLYYICLGCSPGCLSRQVFFRKTSKLSFILMRNFCSVPCPQCCSCLWIVQSLFSFRFTSCLPMVGGSLRVIRLLPQVKLVAMI